MKKLLKHLSKFPFHKLSKFLCTCLIQSLDLANFHSISARSCRFNDLQKIQQNLKQEKKGKRKRYLIDGIKFTFFHVSLAWIGTDIGGNSPRNSNSSTIYFWTIIIYDFVHVKKSKSREISGDLKTRLYSWIFSVYLVEDGFYVI